MQILTQIRYYLFLSEVYNSNGLPDKALKTLQSAEKTRSGQLGQVHLALADIYRDKKMAEDSFNELTWLLQFPTWTLIRK